MIAMIYDRTIAPQRLPDLRRNGISKRALRRVKEDTSVVLVQLDGINMCGQLQWHVIVFCAERKIMLADGKTLHEHKFEQPSDGRITPCGATGRVSSHVSEASGEAPSFW